MFFVYHRRFPQFEFNSNWNSIFCDSICMASLGHNCFLYVQFDVAHKRYVATSNVDLVDDMIVTVC